MIYAFLKQGFGYILDNKLSDNVILDPVEIQYTFSKRGTNFISLFY